MKIKVTKEQMKMVGNGALKIGKSIIIEGTKAVISKGAVNVVVEGLDNGVDGIKKLRLDDVLGKKKTFLDLLKSKRKKKIKVTEEELSEVLTEAIEVAYDAGREDATKLQSIKPVTPEA